MRPHNSQNMGGDGEGSIPVIGLEVLPSLLATLDEGVLPRIPHSWPRLRALRPSKVNAVEQRLEPDLNSFKLSLLGVDPLLEIQELGLGALLVFCKK